MNSLIKNKIKATIILNIILVSFEVLSVIWMFSGFKIWHEDALTAKRIQMLIFFTVDSNILMGLFGGYSLIEEIKVYKGLKENVNKTSLILYFVGAVGVTLTMLVTVFYLMPMMAGEKGWFTLFKNSNLFFHLINPLLSIVTFVLCKDANKMTIKETLYGVIPMVAYGIFYAGNALLNMEDGKILKENDWYGFFGFGTYSILIVFPLMVLITYGISVGLYKLSKLKHENKK